MNITKRDALSLTSNNNKENQLPLSIIPIKPSEYLKISCGLALAENVHKRNKRNVHNTKALKELALCTADER